MGVVLPDWFQCFKIHVQERELRDSDTSDEEEKVFKRYRDELYSSHHSSDKVVIGIEGKASGKQGLRIVKPRGRRLEQER